MPPPDQEGYLADILIYARKIQTFTRGVSEAAFTANEEKQLAVIRCLEVIGEAVSRLSLETQKELLSVELHLMRGMRNRLIHDYRNVQIKVVWNTIVNDIDPLVHALQARLPKQG